MTGAHLVQVAYAVRDLRGAAHSWHEATGVGPFHIVDHVEHDFIRSEGGPVVVDYSVAVTWWGTVMLELVEFHGQAPALDAAGSWLAASSGLHHVASFVPDLDAVDRGDRFIEARTADARYLMVDTVAELGHRSEYYEETPFMRALYDGVRRSSERWTGERLVRG